MLELPIRKSMLEIKMRLDRGGPIKPGRHGQGNMITLELTMDDVDSLVARHQPVIATVGSMKVPKIPEGWTPTDRVCAFLSRAAGNTEGEDVISFDFDHRNGLNCIIRRDKRLLDLEPTMLYGSVEVFTSRASLTRAIHLGIEQVRVLGAHKIAEAITEQRQLF